MTSEDLLDRLARRHPLPSWVFVPEVPDGTGRNKVRTADALALDCYPSRGCEVHGFEIKVSRGDWLRELKKPEKHVSVASYCDRWWIVAPAGVVLKEELPKAWGLYEAREGHEDLRAVVKGTLIERSDMDASFVAGLLRTVVQKRENLHDRALEAARQEGIAQGEKNAARTANLPREKTRQLLVDARAFERASGIRLSEYEGAGDVGKALRMILALMRYGGWDDLERLANSIDAEGCKVRDLHREIKALVEKASAPPEKDGVPCS